MSRFQIAAQTPTSAELHTLYTAAFPDEPLMDLVGSLLALNAGVLSLAARADGELAGHGLFTQCTLEDGGVASLLGPLAVAPKFQRQGAGSALIKAGVDHLRGTQASRVLVLGDPEYYARFGFEPERDVLPTHPIPDEWAEAWRSIVLTDAPARGRLLAPEPWDDPALWQ